MNELVGLLWSKETDDFPEAELKKALHRFSQRREFQGQRPDQVHLNPLQTIDLGETLLGIRVASNAHIGLNHLWLTGVVDENFIEEEVDTMNNEQLIMDNGGQSDT